MNSEIKEAAENYAEKRGFRVPYDGSNEFYDAKVIKYSIEGFKEGALSYAAKQYWFAQFQSQKQSAVWVKASGIDKKLYPKTTTFIRYNNGEDKDLGDFGLITELIENGWNDVEYLDETPQPQLSESEIEKLAAKEYPLESCLNEDMKYSYCDLQNGFIKGYIAAQTQHP